jgi:hypothetical protein
MSRQGLTVTINPVAVTVNNRCYSLAKKLVKIELQVSLREVTRDHLNRGIERN